MRPHTLLRSSSRTCVPINDRIFLSLPHAHREKRNKAVLKGMKYMKKFLLKDNCKALYDIGDDAPSIFFEIWYQSSKFKVMRSASCI